MIFRLLLLPAFLSLSVFSGLHGLLMATLAVVSATPHRQYLLLAIKELSALTALQFFGKAGRKAAGRPAGSLAKLLLATIR